MNELNEEFCNKVENRNYNNQNKFLSNILENNNIIWIILILIFLIFFCKREN